MPRNYTPAERALCLIGVLAGKGLEEINSVLKKGSSDYRPLSARSHELLRTAYVPNMQATVLSQEPLPFGAPAVGIDTGRIDHMRRQDLQRLALAGMYKLQWKHCMHPSTMGQLGGGDD